MNVKIWAHAILMRVFNLNRTEANLNQIERKILFSASVKTISQNREETNLENREKPRTGERYESYTEFDTMSAQNWKNQLKIN